MFWFKFFAGIKHVHTSLISSFYFLILFKQHLKLEKRTIKTNWFESVYPPPQIENKSNVSQTYALLQFKISQDKSLMGCDSYSDEVGDCHGTCSNKLLCDLILGSILFLLLDIICSSYC